MESVVLNWAKDIVAMRRQQATRLEKSTVIITSTTKEIAEKNDSES